ncbi:MAG TPA: 50S ribosomal protein L6 [Mariniflexile sp.]
MSKIGRRPIDINDVTVEIDGQNVNYKGKKASGVYTLPDSLEAKIEDKKLFIIPKKDGVHRLNKRDLNRIWGLNRALLANCIKGAGIGFTRQLKINGLGYKAAVSGKKVVFSLGYSHKINFELPADVALEVDKTGQLLTFSSPDKELVGHVCSMIRALRPPEPYKGTGIKYIDEVIMRKAGKTKS